MAIPVADAPNDPLSGWLEAELGVRLRRRSVVAGGSIHRAWRLELAGGGTGPSELFAKTTRAEALPQLQAEAEGLAALAAFAAPSAEAAAAEAADAGPALVVPQPLAWGRVGEAAVLVLPWCRFGAPPPSQAGGAEWWRRMGAALAGLHWRSAEGAPPQGFGWATDNFIGASPQSNGWGARWAHFFVERRLANQLTLARTGGIALPDTDRLLARTFDRLKGHQPAASLVHGDLWCGNAAFLDDGRPAVFDPAVYWGDREVDLAMARLFGGFPDAFYAGYEESWPLPPGWRERLDLYNLYHLINHLNLFGNGYRSQVEAVIDQLMGGV